MPHESSSQLYSCEGYEEVRKTLYLTDCEGPISKNDNAFEIAEQFIPGGGAFFAKLSRYDDFLADVEKRPGYKAGDTLKLIAPFLKAFGVTDEAMRNFSRETLVLVPRADEVLREVSSLMPTYIISTSYRPYIEALCAAIGFPASNTYCTEIELDSHVLPERETAMLQTLVQEVCGLPDIHLPATVTSFEQLDEGSETTIDRLNKIFWHELVRLESGKLMSSVNPVGGKEKAKAVASAREREGCDWGDVMYIGDSITDKDAMELVRSHGGVAISFNGNRYALQSAEYAVVSQDASVCGVLARVFREHGAEGLTAVAVGWQQKEFASRIVSKEMRDRLDQLVSNGTIFARIVPERLSDLTALSERVRKSVRGTKIGSLG